MKTMIKFLAPLFVDCNDNKISLPRFWINALLISSCYFWFYLGTEIPMTLFQVIMLILTYLLGSKGIAVSKQYFMHKDALINGKQTPEMNRYKADASSAAKCQE